MAWANSADEGIAALRDTTVTELNLRFEPSDVAEGIKHFAEALQHNKTLTTLDLSYNEISDEGVKHIAEALKHNISLTTLDLKDNGIGAEGVKHVAEALKNNTTLKALDLTYNDIGDEGVKHVAEALKHNKTLSTLGLNYNDIGAEGAKHITEVIKHNKTLSTLRLYDNSIGDEGAKYIANALKQNTTLTELDLRANEIRHKGAMFIADAIKCNIALAKLDLDGNEIGKEGVEYVREVVKKSLALRQRLQQWPKPTRKRKLSTEQVVNVNDLPTEPNVVDCTVCMDPKDQLLLLPCLHPVCVQCLQDVKMSLCVCRVCQEPFSSDFLLPHDTATPNTTIYCPQHLDNNATEFCFDCKVLVCAACDHEASHQLYDLEEAMEKMQNDLPPILDDVLMQLGQVNKAIEYIALARSTALNKLASVKSAIQQSYEALNNQELASRRDALLEQAQAIANSQFKILDMQSEELIATKDARETALQQARCFMHGWW